MLSGGSIGGMLAKLWHLAQRLLWALFFRVGPGGNPPSLSTIPTRYNPPSLSTSPIQQPWSQHEGSHELR